MTAPVIRFRSIVQHIRRPMTAFSRPERGSFVKTFCAAEVDSHSIPHIAKAKDWTCGEIQYLACQECREKRKEGTR